MILAVWVEIALMAKQLGLVGTFRWYSESVLLTAINQPQCRNGPTAVSFTYETNTMNSKRHCTCPEKMEVRGTLPRYKLNEAKICGEKASLTAESSKLQCRVRYLLQVMPLCFEGE